MMGISSRVNLTYNKRHRKPVRGSKLPIQIVMSIYLEKSLVTSLN